MSDSEKKDRDLFHIFRFIGMFQKAFMKCLDKYWLRERKYGHSWRSCDIAYLHERLLKEVEEYKESKSSDELVDIVNFCLMLIERQDREQE